MVILGLLVGGVLSGQSLIRAAQLRSVVSEYQRYTTASNTFRDKYFGLPGDITNATSFWGKDSTICNGQPGTASSNGMCNGDGNGLVTFVGGDPNESYQFWRELAAAGLIEGQYSGKNTASGNPKQKIGYNDPASKYTSAGWYVDSVTQTNGETVNFYAFGADAPPFSSWPYPEWDVIKAEDAWNIDTKLDDGMPFTG